MGWPNRVTHRPTQDSSVAWPQERFMSKTKSTFTLFENPSIKKIICDHFYFFEYSMKKGDKKKSNVKLKLILEMSGNFNQLFSIKSQIKSQTFVMLWSDLTFVGNWIHLLLKNVTFKLKIMNVIFILILTTNIIHMNNFLLCTIHL